MRRISCSDFRRNLAGNMDRVHADHEPVLISRMRGKPAAALMSFEDFASSDEARYLLCSQRNAERLLEATKALGEGTEHELAE